MTIWSLRTTILRNKSVFLPVIEKGHGFLVLHLYSYSLNGLNLFLTMENRQQQLLADKHRSALNLERATL